MKLTVRQVALSTAGVVVAGGLVLGGTEAFASSPAPFTTAASMSAATSSTGSKPACRQAEHPRSCAGRRVARRARRRVLEQGVHGQATVNGADGAFVVQEWQVGKVASINGETITVTDASGTTWTWTVQSAAQVRVSGAKGSLSGVHTGDTVLVRGVQNGGANDVTVLSDPNQSKLGHFGHASRSGRPGQPG